jgi:ketol-acid reductoisomerase
MSKSQLFTSKVFSTEAIKLADTEETIVVGGRDKFHLLESGFSGIKQDRCYRLGFAGTGASAEFARFT